MGKNIRLDYLQEDALEEIFSPQTLGELEGIYGVEFSYGAIVVGAPSDKKANTTLIDGIIHHAEIDGDLPVIVLSRRGYSEGAADLASEFEGILLCVLDKGEWVPWDIPA